MPSATASRCPLDIFRLSWRRSYGSACGKTLGRASAADARTVRRDSRIGENGYRAKISAALTEFRHRLAGELHAVEQRAQVLAKELTTTAQQQVRTGIENCSGRLWSRSTS